MLECHVMKLDMDQIDFSINLCKKLEEGYVRIDNVKHLYKDLQDAIKFSVQDVKNVCASSVLLSQ